MNPSARYASFAVAAHFLVSLVHGVAHRALRIALSASDSLFVLLVVVIAPLIAMALLWTKQKRTGLVLLSASMLSSLTFGFYHHFLLAGSDHVLSQPANSWGHIFILSSYGLLLTELIGTYVGIHFLLRGCHRDMTTN